MRALVIEAGSTQAIRSMVAYALRNDGFEVREATTMEAVRAALADGFVPDVIIACRFEGLTGAMPLEAVRAHADLRGVPVLLIAERDELERQVEWRHAGVTCWIIRPFTGAEFLEMAHMMLFSRPGSEPEMQLPGVCAKK